MGCIIYLFICCRGNFAERAVIPKRGFHKAAVDVSLNCSNKAWGKVGVWTVSSAVFQPEHTAE